MGQKRVLGMDDGRELRHVRAVTEEAGKPGIGELLATVAGTVAAVPVVLGFVALGGVVLAGRALRDVAVGALPSRNGRPARRRRPKRPAAP